MDESSALASPAVPVLPPPPAAYGQAKQGVNGFAIASLVLSVCLYGVGSILGAVIILIVLISSGNDSGPSY
ncbi:MAG: hypothetical protein EXQ69_05975 [Acidimicrobiia bacterium]|nr:hypothetical protein [Acidimicrobiia bacterium]